MAEKFVYDFQEGNKEMKDLLGGKGANLAEMTNMGLPVPLGFTVTCAACNAYRAAGREFPEGMLEEVAEHLEQLEKGMGRRLGDPDDPLLVSVRSGAPFSMPGMMDSVLNLGLNDESVEGLTSQTGSERFAWDSYRRLLQMYGRTVMGVEGERFEEALEHAKQAKGVRNDVELDAGDLRGLVEEFKAIISAETGRGFPQDPTEQLKGGIEAVFGSWDNRRAVDYRRKNKIDDSLGTAVNIQAMVFGNKGEDSGTGVAFTRNPANGDPTALRRLPGQCPGRGRGGRDPQHHAAGGDGRGPAAGLGGAAGAHGDPGGAITATCAISSSPSSRASCGCSRPGSGSGPRSPSGSWPMTWRPRA